MILGPPGTGKTTRLLNITQEEMQAGTPPDRIAFVSYTRKAAEEAITRAALKFGLTKEQFPYFRTLHSLAYYMLGSGQHKMMSATHLREAFHKSPGIVIRRAMLPDQWSSPTMGEELDHIYNLARIKCESYREISKSFRPRTGITYSLLEYYVNTIESYKRSQGLCDFTDLISDYVTSGDVPQLDVVIVDEAQDLSRLQWKMVNKLIAKAKRVYVAGDDDQTIYGCFGADVETFIGLPGKQEVLQQSWRCPRRIAKQAGRIIKKVSHRRPKEWLPKDEEGSIKIINEEVIDFKTGQWLIIARNNYLLRGVMERLRSRGHFFLHNNKPLFNPDRIQAVRDWIAIRSGKTIPAGRAYTLTQHLSSTYVNRKKTDRLSSRSADEQITLQQLAEAGVDYRHDWNRALNWDIAPYKYDKEIRYYVEQMIVRNTDASDRIKVSTIHAAKGGEAENVVILSDVSSVADRSQFERASRDAEHRVFYVGVTRSSQNLFVVPPRTNSYYRGLV